MKKTGLYLYSAENKIQDTLVPQWLNINRKLALHRPWLSTEEKLCTIDLVIGFPKECLRKRLWPSWQCSIVGWSKQFGKKGKISSSFASAQLSDPLAELRELRDSNKQRYSGAPFRMVVLLLLYLQNKAKKKSINHPQHHVSFIAMTMPHASCGELIRDVPDLPARNGTWKRNKVGLVPDRKSLWATSCSQLT